jgi:hypothetical protein
LDYFLYNFVLATKGFAMSNTERPEQNLQNIQQQLETAKQELDALKMHPRESLRDFEYRVKAHSDKILSLKVAEQVQQQQIEQDARETEEQLKKKNP